MTICEQHWKKMRDAIEARGMTPLVSPTGMSAALKTMGELADRKVTLDTFDPLMAMFWNISGNLMERLGPAVGYLLTSGPEDPIDVDKIPWTTTCAGELKVKYGGRTWPRCVICYCNISHEITCRETRCQLKRVNGWDIAIDYAADAVRQQFEELMKARS